MKEPLALKEGLENAQSLVFAKKFDQADSVFSQLEEAFPEFAVVRLEWGKLYSLNRQYAQAVGKLIEATELDTLSYDAFYELGKNLNLQGWFDQAVVALKRAVEVDPDCSGAFVELAKSYEMQAMKDEALAVYVRAVALLKEEKNRKLTSLDDFDCRAPLLFGDRHFLHFEAYGNVENLVVESIDTEKDNCLRVIVFENKDAERLYEPAIGELLEEGTLLRERFLRSLPIAIKAKAELSVTDTFQYKLYKNVR